MVWPRRAVVGAVVAAGVLLALVASFFMAEKWRAKAVLLPVEESSGLLDAALGMFPAFARGFAKAGASSTDKMIVILESYTLSEAVAAKLDLAKVIFADEWDADKGAWKDEAPDPREVVRRLREGILRVEETQSGALQVSVTLGAPQVAADVANAYVDELAAVLRENTVSRAKQTRQFLEKQIAENEERLRRAEETLVNFSEQNQRVILDTSTSTLLSETSAYMTDIAAREVAVMVLRNFLPEDDPKMVRYREEIAHLRERLERFTRERDFSGGASMTSIPFEKVPLMTLEYQRLKRELDTLEQVQRLLQEELEKSRIQEAGEALSFQIVDSATPPHIRSWPRRGFVTVIAFLVSTAVGLVAAIALHLRDARSGSGEGAPAV